MSHHLQSNVRIQTPSFLDILDPSSPNTQKLRAAYQKAQQNPALLGCPSAKLFAVFKIHGLRSEQGSTLNDRLVEFMAFDQKTGRAMLRINPQDRKECWKKIKLVNISYASFNDDWSAWSATPLGCLLERNASQSSWTAFGKPVASSWFPTAIQVTEQLVKLYRDIKYAYTEVACFAQFDDSGRMLPSLKEYLEGPLEALSRASQALLLHVHVSRLDGCLMKMDAMKPAVTRMMDNALVKANALISHRLKKFFNRLCNITWHLGIAFVFSSSLPSLGCSMDASLSKQLPSPDSTALASDSMTSVIQEVDHSGEEAATRDADLLELQAQHDWVERVEWMNRKVSTVEGATDSKEQIFLFPYTRAPRAFMEALLHGPDLDPIRKEMDKHECAYVLKESGAKVFVWPHQYPTVIEELSKLEQQLYSSYVIAAESLLPCIEASIAAIPSLKNVRVKQSGVRKLTTVTKVEPRGGQEEHALQPNEEESQEEEVEEPDWEQLLSVERTFICEVTHLRASQSVTQSTTEVHGGVNPRRRIV